MPQEIINSNDFGPRVCGCATLAHAPHGLPFHLQLTHPTHALTTAVLLVPTLANCTLCIKTCVRVLHTKGGFALQQGTLIPRQLFFPISTHTSSVPAKRGKSPLHGTALPHQLLTTNVDYWAVGAPPPRPFAANTRGEQKGPNLMVSNTLPPPPRFKGYCSEGRGGVGGHNPALLHPSPRSQKVLGRPYLGSWKARGEVFTTATSTSRFLPWFIGEHRPKGAPACGYWPQ